MTRDNTLFSDGDLATTLENSKKRAVEHVRNLGERQFELISEDSLVDDVCDWHRLAPLVIRKRPPKALLNDDYCMDMIA